MGEQRHRRGQCADEVYKEGGRGVGVEEGVGEGGRCMGVCRDADGSRGNEAYVGLGEGGCVTNWIREVPCS